MERLTYWCDDGMGSGEYRVNENGAEYSGHSIDRLAAYEDTGLEPEEINDFVESYKTMRDNEEARVRLMCGTGAIHPERAAEITKAEAEGRLLVLPCKVGGDLWVNDRDGKPRRMVLDAPDIRCHCAKEDNLCIALCDSPKDGVCAYRLKNDGTDFGQKIFRTREEAEAALKERENNG